MTKIISVSDFHIHDDSKLDMVRELVRRIEELKPDILVYLGDVGDPWEETWDVIMATQSWKELSELNRHRWRVGLINI